MISWNGSSCVELEAWKMAEDSTNFVIRVRETFGQPASGKLRFGFPVRAVQEANMLEEPGLSINHAIDAAPLRLRAHQALTLIVKPKS